MATAQSNTIYNFARQVLFGNVSSVSIDFDADTFKAALMGSGYTPNFSTDNYWSAISSGEIAAGNGYTAGGVTLTGNTVSTDGSGFKFTTTGPSPLWTASGGSIAAPTRLVIYKSTGTASTSPLVCCQLLASADQVAVSSGSTFNMTPDATHGWVNIA